MQLFACFLVLGLSNCFSVGANDPLEEFTVHKGQYMIGADIKALWDVTAESCAEACLQQTQPKCWAFNFLIERELCFLKDTSDLETNYLRNTDFYTLIGAVNKNEGTLKGNVNKVLF